MTAGWELFARGPDDLLRIQLARGQITQTYVPPLETANPDVAFVIGAREVVIRSTDYVPGYVVPDGHQARLLTGPLAGDGPLVSGRDGAQAAWVPSGPPTSPTLSLVALTGQPSGPSIRFPQGGPQLPATAVSDGRGYVLDDRQFQHLRRRARLGPAGAGHRGRGRPGHLARRDLQPAVSPHCRNEVVDVSDGARRVLPGPVAAEPYYFSYGRPRGDRTRRQPQSRKQLPASRRPAISRLTAGPLVWRRADPTAC